MAKTAAGGPNKTCGILLPQYSQVRVKKSRIVSNCRRQLSFGDVTAEESWLGYKLSLCNSQNSYTKLMQKTSPLSSLTGWLKAASYCNLRWSLGPFDTNNSQIAGELSFGDVTAHGLCLNNSVYASSFQLVVLCHFRKVLPIWTHHGTVEWKTHAVDMDGGLKCHRRREEGRGKTSRAERQCC